MTWGTLAHVTGGKTRVDGISDLLHHTEKDGGTLRPPSQGTLGCGYGDTWPPYAEAHQTFWKRGPGPVRQEAGGAQAGPQTY